MNSFSHKELDSIMVSGKIKSDSLQMGFRLYDSESDKKRPLLIFLHGAGERGDDNKKQLTWSISDILKNAKELGEDPIILAPQCPEGKRWVEVHWGDSTHTQPQNPSLPLQVVINSVNDFIKLKNVDESRIYLVGISMGGFGVWDWITREPNLFAAAIPVCGGVDESAISVLSKLPIWAFHGALDTVVKPERSRRPVLLLQKIKSPILYTEYPNSTHNAWSKTFQNLEVLKWLFSQKKE